MRFERPNSRRICMASRTHCSRVPRVYLGWANPVFLAFFAFNRINNLRIFSVALSPIPTAPTNIFLILLYLGRPKGARGAVTTLLRALTPLALNHQRDYFAACFSKCAGNCSPVVAHRLVNIGMAQEFLLDFEIQPYSRN